MAGRYEFTLTLTGEGDTPEEAWMDAVEAFSADPGCPQEPGVLIESDAADDEEAK